jgi:hypothetical protein
MGENTQTNENKEPSQKTETQSRTIEGAEVFCPLQLSQENSEEVNRMETEGSRVETEQKLQELLKNINEESLELSKFLAGENKLINEACTSLALVLEKLGVSFNIPPQDIPFQRKVKKAILNHEGHLALTYEGDEKHSGFLGEYPPEIVMAVLWIVIPELARTNTIHRKRISIRASFFGRVKEELKTVAKAIAAIHEGKTEPEKK